MAATEQTPPLTLEEQKRQAAKANKNKSAPMEASPRPVTTTGTPEAVRTTVTPEQAEQWLLANTNNRNLRSQYIDNLAAAIQRGEWQFNGDAIRFDVNGVLIDGQHRLWACVLAETAIDTLVITGLPAETQDTMDMGARRKLSDVLQLRRGITDPVTTGAALNLLFRLKNGQVRAGRGAVPTVAQALALLDEHPEIMDSVKVAHKVRRGGVMIPLSALSVAHWQFARIPDATVVNEGADESDVDYFFNRLADGALLAPKSPILALRRAADHQHKGRERPPTLWYHAVLIKAWNAFRKGQEREMMTFKMGGARPEPFPEPV